MAQGKLMYMWIAVNAYFRHLSTLDNLAELDMLLMASYVAMCVLLSLTSFHLETI